MKREKQTVGARLRSVESTGAEPPPSIVQPTRPQELAPFRSGASRQPEIHAAAPQSVSEWPRPKQAGGDGLRVESRSSGVTA
eukprot:CAMPEP_0118989910 /NCGR_PEP_ID=MMETSP1173-20130426/48874_1 /TAXON_ID=1034831 /ORGANISM="Rhizochromulina marina cf, Strain CCMP1243" /LENGTH=81 /DNA_ID=CAMNT_0006940925 /DNA_START=19 /DNA_END=261 /DNA_ORIENTATION=-